MVEKGAVGQLGLVLYPDPVLGHVVPHHMLWDHDLHRLLGVIVGNLQLLMRAIIQVLREWMPLSGH